MYMTTTVQVVIPTDADGLMDAGVDLRNMMLLGIMMPATWTAADLTFQGSVDNSTFYDVYDSDDAEVVVQAAQQRFIGLTATELDVLSRVPYIKIRSGTTSAPVAQGAARTLTLVVESS